MEDGGGDERVDEGRVQRGRRRFAKLGSVMRDRSRGGTHDARGLQTLGRLPTLGRRPVEVVRDADVNAQATPRHHAVVPHTVASTQRPRLRPRGSGHRGERTGGLATWLTRGSEILLGRGATEVGARQFARPLARAHRATVDSRCCWIHSLSHS
jgi:hypothetical protein